MNNVLLKSIELRNFKTHENLVIPISKKTEIYGGNATGKSSVMEALKFNLFGGKADVSKIKTGAEEALVKTNWVELKNGEEIKTSIIKKIKNNGKVSVKINYNGISPQSPAKFIKTFVSVGSFDPKELIVKEGRTERLLSLLKAETKKEDFKGLSLLRSEDIDWSSDAFSVLKQVEKDLRNTRESLYREKELKLKAYESNENLAADKEGKIREKYGNIEAENYKKVIEEKTRLQVEAEQKISLRKAQTENLEMVIKSIDQKDLEIEERLKAYESNMQKIRELQLENDKLQRERQELEDTQKLMLKDKKEAILFLRETDDFQKSFDKTLLELNQKAQKAEEVEELNQMKERLKKEKESADKSVKIHKAIDSQIKIDFKAIREKTLKPAIEKIKGLSFEEDGLIRLNGVVIDELSESESVRLGLELLSQNKGEEFICIDGAESVTPENLNKLNTGNKTTIVLRVAKEPLGDGWQSHKIT